MWVASIFIVLYCVWLSVMLVTWLTMISADRTCEHPHDSPSLFYSIVIPFRNEAENLKKLIDSVHANAFPKEAYEIILVNDHSTDNSWQVAGELEDVRLLRLEDKYGKKNALAHGISEAKGDVIVTTDADCEVSEKWLASIRYYFEEKSAKLVSGAVTFKGEINLFHHMQTIEFASLVGVGAATIHMKIPGMCNGANLAFDRQVFHEVGGYMDNDHLASGDDEFLLHKISAKYPERIFFNTARRSWVKTKPLNTIAEFAQQRKRWASKWKWYDNLRNSLLAAFIGLVNLSVLIALFYAVYGEEWAWFLLLPKVVLEGIFLGSVLRFVDKYLHLVYFSVLQVIYPFYVVYFAAISNISGYTWKGRRY